MSIKLKAGKGSGDTGGADVSLSERMLTRFSSLCPGKQKGTIRLFPCCDFDVCSLFSGLRNNDSHLLVSFVTYGPNYEAEPKGMR